MENFVCFFVSHWLKDCRCRTYFSISFPILKNPMENPVFIFLENLCRFSSTIFLHPSRSWRFLFYLKAKIGGSWNTSLNSWFIWSKFQLLVIALFTLGNIRLHVNTSDVLLLCFFVCFFGELLSAKSLSPFYTLVYFLLFVSSFN